MLEPLAWLTLEEGSALRGARTCRVGVAPFGQRTANEGLTRYGSVPHAAGWAGTMTAASRQRRLGFTQVRDRYDLHGNRAHPDVVARKLTLVSGGLWPFYDGTARAARSVAKALAPPRPVHASVVGEHPIHRHSFTGSSARPRPRGARAHTNKVVGCPFFTVAAPWSCSNSEKRTYLTVMPEPTRGMQLADEAVARSSVGSYARSA